MVFLLDTQVTADWSSVTLSSKVSSIGFYWSCITLENTMNTMNSANSVVNTKQLYALSNVIPGDTMQINRQGINI